MSGERSYKQRKRRGEKAPLAERRSAVVASTPGCGGLKPAQPASANPRSIPVAAACALLVGLEFAWLGLALHRDSSLGIATMALAMVCLMLIVKRMACALADRSVVSTSTRRAKFETQVWDMVIQSSFCAAEALILFVPGYEGADGRWASDTREGRRVVVACARAARHVHVHRYLRRVTHTLLI